MVLCSNRSSLVCPQKKKKKKFPCAAAAAEGNPRRRPKAPPNPSCCAKSLLPPPSSSRRRSGRSVSMALRYLARRVGTPALRWAPAPRLSPPAGSGPLATRSSQVGYSNGLGNARKMGNISGKEKDLRDELFEVLSELKESIVATRETIEAAKRRRKIIYRGLTAGVVGMAVYTISFIVEEENERRREIKKFLSEE